MERNAQDLLARAARASREGAPVLDGELATFVWQGRKAPKLGGDFTNWSDAPLALEEVSPGLWARSVRFLPGAYIEYAYFAGKTRMPDPLNPRVTPNGIGYDNHFFYLPGAGPTPLAQPAADFPAGTLTRHALPGRPFLTTPRRSIWLYQPPGEGPFALWVVWDGKDYLERASLVNIMENMVAAGRIRPAAMAFVDSGPNRMVEYNCGETTLAFVLEVLLPFARAHLRLLDPAQQPGSYGVLGASMGGLMALYTGLRLPHIFGRVLSQSGAFRLGEGHLPVARELIEYGPVPPVRIWMDAGRYEWLLQANRDTHAQLLRRGYDVTYHEYPAGHNYPAWRDDLPHGLEHLLGHDQ